jgi:hypothetical protein
MCYCCFPLGTNACMHIDLRPVAENKRLGEIEGEKKWCSRPFRTTGKLGPFGHSLGRFLGRLCTCQSPLGGYQHLCSKHTQPRIVAKDEKIKQGCAVAVPCPSFPRLPRSHGTEPNRTMRGSSPASLLGSNTNSLHGMQAFRKRIEYPGLPWIDMRQTLSSTDHKVF